MSNYTLKENDIKINTLISENTELDVKISALISKNDELRSKNNSLNSDLEKMSSYIFDIDNYNIKKDEENGSIIDKIILERNNLLKENEELIHLHSELNNDSIIEKYEKLVTQNNSSLNTINILKSEIIKLKNEISDSEKKVNPLLSYNDELKNNIKNICEKLRDQQ